MSECIKSAQDLFKNGSERGWGGSTIFSYTWLKTKRREDAGERKRYKERKEEKSSWLSSVTINDIAKNFKRDEMI